MPFHGNFLYFFVVSVTFVAFCRLKFCETNQKVRTYANDDGTKRENLDGDHDDDDVI